MGVSRVDFGGETLVDLTGDTVTPQSLLNGYSAHNKAGELIEGLAVIPTVGNGTVTIKQNGVSKGTFTMNQSGNTKIELTDNNTTYKAATQSANGLMTAADKKKLDGLTPTTSLAVTQRGMSVLDGVVGKELNDKFGGCSLEQEGQEFYIVGADAVRKKLGDSVDITGGFSLAVSYRNAGYNSSSISISPCNKKHIDININDIYTSTTISIGNTNYTTSGTYNIENADSIVVSTQFVSAPSGVTGGRCSGNYRLY